MDCVNTVRERVWKEGRKGALEEALIDVDGTITGTYGEWKEGMDMSYKGIWSYTPLIVSLANTREVLYIENCPGNVPSHSGAVEWIDKAIALVKPHAKRVCLRGDTDFSFDKFKKRCLSFFENIGEYKDELRTLLTDNFEIIGEQFSKT